MTDYYNEIDPYAAQFLRNLIAGGHIPYGHVDTRSIEDVTPADLAGYTQCHFFAGLGGWPLALQLAGWPRDRPVWTGSCPCQPFSAAGKGNGFEDERHLWPAWQHLVSECRPSVVFGEQVASKAAEPWIDLVHADLEALGYAFGCIPFPAAGVGAPHIRDRTYWVGVTTGIRREGLWKESAYRQPLQASKGAGRLGNSHGERQDAQRGVCGGPESEPAGGGDVVRLAHAEQHRGGCEATGTDHRESQADRPANQHGRYSSAPVRLADTRDQRFVEQHVCLRERSASGDVSEAGWSRGADVEGRLGADGSYVGSLQVPAPASPTNGFWRAADWLLCRDGKWRPVEPGTFPLAHGVSGRVGRLRAYGNAIVPQAAAEFIRSFAEASGLSLEAA